MASVAPVDSREYRFGFVIGTKQHAPEDFPVPEDWEGFRTALFLPRDDAGWFGRSPYPPRMVLLSREALEVRGHPHYKEETTRFKLAELDFVETGHILLLGWLRVVAAQSERLLPYNMRSWAAVERFLAHLREEYAPPAPALGFCDSRMCGEPLDLKFKYARARELAPEERVACQLFSPAVRHVGKWGILRHEFWEPADLVLMTERRIMWISDRHHGRHQRYGTVTRYAPVQSLTGVACPGQGGSFELCIALGSAASWRIPLPAEMEKEAGRFGEESDRLRAIWKPLTL